MGDVAVQTQEVITEETMADPSFNLTSLYYRGNDPVLHIIASIVVTIIVLMTVFGNIFNLLVLARTRALHNNPGFFMISLAVADLGAGVVNLVTSIPSAYLNFWPFENVTCDIAGFLAAWFYTVSIYTLTAVSIDRFVAISRPLRYYDLFPKRHCKICILILWLLGTVIFLVPFMGYGYYEYKWTTYICMCDFTKHFWLTMAADFLVIIPCTLTTAFCYLKIYMISRRHSKEIRNQVHDQAASKTSARLKALRTVAITVLAFYLSWVPYTIQQTTFLFLKGVTTPPAIDFTLNWMALGNSFMNCIIYSITNKVYRDSGRQMLVKIFCFCRGKVDPNSMGNGNSSSEPLKRMSVSYA